MSKVQEKIGKVRQAMVAKLVEREDEVAATLAALLCREHVLFVGPPGVGKSALLEGLLSHLGGKKFSYLMNKFVSLEELFGPLSLASLKEDKYRRVTRDRMADADWVFLDEVFRSSSAALNATLKVLNERVYDAGDGPQTVPLQLCLAASNDWPSAQDGGKELGALFDRFLFRREVKPVRSRKGRERLLWEDGLASWESPSPRLTTQEVDEAAREAQSLPVSREAREAYEEVLDKLAKEGIRPGDRRVRKGVKAAKAAAYLAGEDRVTPDSLDVLKDVLWEDPQEQPRLVENTLVAVCNPARLKLTQLLVEAQGILDTADPKDIAGITESMAKLKNIAKSLKGISHVPGAPEALAWLEGEGKRLKAAMVEGF